ncbi:hypothetical protein Y887_14125 [Xanthomonas pisi DSM 18956]|uniref:Uncharacterized protein n=1 Tax=Xanthomonas pisi TaxID=56457 RepID=A0A2S7D135_9XANT|nr:hypothetical protein Y887_14125 [Xanthomonas pisi DSM 18956]PPU67424.1 hypothetical protein XpiCFBP4643_15635 [Xanthomonas pisi]
MRRHLPGKTHSVRPVHRNALASPAQHWTMQGERRRMRAVIDGPPMARIASGWMSRASDIRHQRLAARAVCVTAA